MNINRTWKYAWKFTLTADEFYIVKMKGAKYFSNEWLEIIPLSEGRAQIRISAGYSWDGCSVVPDAPGTKRASCLHDALYQSSDDIAARWLLDQSDVLHLADKAFLEVMRTDGCPVAGLYYAGVRVFGRTFRFFSRLFGV